MEAEEELGLDHLELHETKPALTLDAVDARVDPVWGLAPTDESAHRGAAVRSNEASLSRRSATRPAR
jgi:hypothetical protein